MSEVDFQEPAKTKPAPRAPAEAVEHALRSAIDAHGPDAFYAGDALEVFLSRRCPDAGNDIALLRIGLDEQVPQALVGLHTAQDLDSLARKLQQRLSSRRSLNRYAAAWVVKTWIDALRLRGEPFPSTIPAPAPPPLRPAAVSPSPAVAPRPAQPPRPAPPIGIPVAARASTLPSSAGSARWVPIGMAIVAMVVVTFAILFESRMTRPAADAPNPSAPEAVVDRADAKPSGPAPAVTVVDVGSDEPLLGDGRRRALFVALNAPRDDIRNVEMRFVAGDESLASRPAVTDVRIPGPLARVPAGSIGLRTSVPLKATFEFVVTTGDGIRSAPFRKEVAIAAAVPAIANVTVPGSIAPEQPLASTTPVDANSFRNEPRRVAIDLTAGVVPAPRGSPPCTRTTCGSVVAVHETGPGTRASGASPPTYEIIVRTDDRVIHTFRQATKLKAGARARVVDGKLLVLNAAPRGRTPYREGRLVPESEPAVSP